MMDEKEFAVAKLIGEIKRVLPPEFVEYVQSKGKNRDQIQYLTSIFLIEMGRARLERQGIYVQPRKKRIQETTDKQQLPDKSARPVPKLVRIDDDENEKSEPKDTPERPPVKPADSPWRYQPKYDKWEPEKIVKKFPKR
jgi:hypothetical protein